MDFVASSGIQEEWQMGYTSYSGASQLNCTLKSSTSHSLRGTTGRPLLGKPVAIIDGYSLVGTNDYKAAMNAVAKTGPLVVAVACDNWHLYKGGVFTDDKHDKQSYDINHAVVLMGYGTDPETGEDYWLVQNSWGPLWGTYHAGHRASTFHYIVHTRGSLLKLFSLQARMDSFVSSVWIQQHLTIQTRFVVWM